jgi:hypothetical protein
MTSHNIELAGGEKITISSELLNLSEYLKQKSNEDPIKLEIGKDVFDKVKEFLEIFNKIGKIEIPEPLPDKKNFEEILKKKEYVDFINVDFEMVFELINAGALLELELLHDLSCAKVAHFMKGKSPEEVNQFFTIECQLTNEEAKDLGLEVEEDN